MKDYRKEIADIILERLRDFLMHNNIYLKVDTDNVGLSIMLRDEDEPWTYNNVGKIDSRIVDVDAINDLLGYDEDEEDEDYE